MPIGAAQALAVYTAARSAGADAVYREIHSDKGHDAFLVEWDQLSLILSGAVDRAREPVDVSA